MIVSIDLICWVFWVFESRSLSLKMIQKAKSFDLEMSGLVYRLSFDFFTELDLA